MFKEGADGFWIGKYEPEDCFRVIVFNPFQPKDESFVVSCKDNQPMPF